MFIEIERRLSDMAQSKVQKEKEKTVEAILAMSIEKQYLTLLEN